MKKYIATFALGLALASGLVSCDKDTEGLTGITYYPVIELEGPTYDQVVSGKAFVDPGYKATLNGEDITGQVSISTKMDLSNPKPGYYTLTYSAVNSDGFSSSAVRYVLVSDPDDKASGYYNTDPKSFRVTSSATTFYGGSYPAIVAGNGDGTYYVSNLLGGYYQYRAGYGSNYACYGTISIDSDNNIDLVDSHVIGWGDSADYIKDGSFDPSTETLSWVIRYAGMDFHVIMSK